MTIEVGNLVCVKMWPIPFPIYEKPSQMFAMFGFKDIKHALENQFHKEISIFPEVHYFDPNAGTRWAFGVVLSKHIYSHKVSSKFTVVKDFYQLLIPGFSKGMWFVANDVVYHDSMRQTTLKPVFFSEDMANEEARMKEW